MAVKVILSFDYELFLGNPSGHVRPSLLAPTEKILKIFDRFNAKGVFFVDVCYLEKCRDDAPELFAEIGAQLKKMYESGHELGLHTHPHWQDAYFENAQWTFHSFDKFRLHNLRSEQVREIFESGVKTLKQIVDDPTFAPKSFRAGGWCIQPFADLRSAFQLAGVEIDSSVVPGLFSDKRPLHYYDFSKTPDRQWWRFSEDPLQQHEQGEFVELPITMAKVSGFELLINKILLRLKNQKTFGDGRGIYIESSRGQQLRRIFQKNIRKFSIEGTSLWLLKRMMRRAQKQKFLHFVMHPKSLTDHALQSLEYILRNHPSSTLVEIVKQNEE